MKHAGHTVIYRGKGITLCVLARFMLATFIQSAVCFVKRMQYHYFTYPVDQPLASQKIFEKRVPAQG
jgi:hypothetical protein